MVMTRGQFPALSNNTKKTMVKPIKVKKPPKPKKINNVKPR
jgi:hypothetical protein